jgi:hypothetical protein
MISGPVALITLDLSFNPYEYPVQEERGRRPVPIGFVSEIVEVDGDIVVTVDVTDEPFVDWIELEVGWGSIELEL